MDKQYNLFERHLVAAVVPKDDVIGAGLHSLLDEAQQVLLIHARRRVHVSVYLQSPQSRDTHTLNDDNAAWRKVMAAYRRVYGLGHLRADCRGPGSAPEPYARFEYGTTFISASCAVLCREVVV